MNDRLWLQWFHTILALLIGGVVANLLTAPLIPWSSALSLSFMNDSGGRLKEMILILIVSALIGMAAQLVFSGISKALITFFDRRYGYAPFFAYGRLFSSLFFFTWAATTIFSVVAVLIASVGSTFLTSLILRSVFASFSASSLGIFMGLYFARVKK